MNKTCMKFREQHCISLLQATVFFLLFFQQSLTSSTSSTVTCSTTVEMNGKNNFGCITEYETGIHFKICISNVFFYLFIANKYPEICLEGLS